jgi:long-chain acyl-CoA synthetase
MVHGRTAHASVMNGPGDILPAAAAAFGDKTALVTDARTLSFAELDTLSTQVAGALAARGIRRGDRVAIYSQNRWEWIVAYHGTLKAGAVVNPINVMLTAEEVRFVLRDCAASLLFAADSKMDGLHGVTDEVASLREVVCFGTAPEHTVAFDTYLDGPADFTPAAVSPTEPSTIGYTSGTTGHPKGAIQSQQAVLLNCRSTASMHARVSDDIVVTALPAPHVYGNVAINSTFLVGGTVVLMERFDAGTALGLIERHRATMFEGVPAMYSMLLAHDDIGSADLSSLTRSTVGGQTIALSTIEAWQRRSGAKLVELWGMTEISGLGTTHWDCQQPVPGSIGVALPGAEVRVSSLDDPSVTVEPGTPGELMIRGPLVMLGYFGNDEATAQALEPDGWLHTGDVAYMDTAGYFFIVDRRKDMIITAGYNVYPAEIERVLAAHPAVAMVAVGPVPDEVKGELARAYVVLRAGSEGSETLETELIDYCRRRLAAYKLPRSVRFVDHLPQTSTGKIMRRELKKLSAGTPLS